MQEIDFYLVDAFSNTSFGGNPAAGCPLGRWLPDETLLKMAQQHNQSETAFFVCTKGGIELRLFTTLTGSRISAVTPRWPPRTCCLLSWITRTRGSTLIPPLAD